jgi:hypothetical protein
LSFLVAAVLLPCLFWDKGTETASLLHRARIGHVCVPAAIAHPWSGVSGISAEIVDPQQLTRVLSPSVTFHAEDASATRAPWVNSNGWRFLRQPSGRFYYEAPGKAASVAAAEAFTYRVKAVIHTDDAGVEPFGKMLAFLEPLADDNLLPLVNIGLVDDGSPQSGEFMNLLVRRNLLFRVVKRPDPKIELTVELGSAEYPRSEAGNPSLLAEKVRSNLTDEKRLLRLYGSEVVIGRLVGDGNRTRLYLLNYAAARSPVQGMRIRLLGIYPHQELAQYDAPASNLLDVSTAAGATEFTVRELKTFAVITLSH